jgi:hypothetical protein
VRLRRFLRRLGPVQHQHLADVLHGVRPGALADTGERHFALLAVERRGAQLDQLVVRERAVDLGQDGVGEALFADLQDRMQGMRARPERLALRGRQRGRRGDRAGVRL